MILPDGSTQYSDLHFVEVICDAISTGGTVVSVMVFCCALFETLHRAWSSMGNGPRLITFAVSGATILVLGANGLIAMWNAPPSLPIAESRDDVLSGSDNGRDWNSSTASEKRRLCIDIERRTGIESSWLQAQLNQAFSSQSPLNRNDSIGDMAGLIGAAAGY